jgi:hypothetical protein
VNRYNGSAIVITVHINTQKYSKEEIFSKKPECIVTTIWETYNDLINRYNVLAQLIQRLFFLNRYNDS